MRRKVVKDCGWLTRIAGSLLGVLILAGCASDPDFQQRQLALVVEKGANRVTVLDRRTNEIAGSIVTGAGPHQIAVHEESGLAAVSNYGVAESPGASLTIIDLHLMQPVRTISLGRYRRPHGLQFFSDGRKILVASEESRTVLVVDAIDGLILQMIPTGRVGSRTVLLSSDEQIAYAIGAADNQLVALDTASSRLLEVVSLPMRVENMDLSADGRELWLASRLQDSILILDTESLETVATLACPGGPISIRFLPEGSPETADLLISLSHDAGLSFFSFSKREELGRLSLKLREEELEQFPPFELAPVPVEAAVDRRNRLVYVTSSNTDLVTVVDALTFTIVRRFLVGDEPEGVAIVDLVTKKEDR